MSRRAHGRGIQESIPERTIDQCGAPKSAAPWLPIESAPKDGTSFLALQDGEVWRAYGSINSKTGEPYFVRRTHERQQGRTYRLMEVEIDGVWGQHRVLTAEEPDDYQFHWVSWSRGFDFAPTHWALLPVTAAREHSLPRQVDEASPGCAPTQSDPQEGRSSSTLQVGKGAGR